MKKRALIITGVILIILLGLVFGFSYKLINERTRQKPPTENSATEKPEVITAKDVNFNGTVKEVLSSALIMITSDVVPGTTTLEVSINEETKFFLTGGTKLENGVMVPVPETGIKLENIKLGDKIDILAKKENGNLIGINIFVSPR